MIFYAESKYNDNLNFKNFWKKKWWKIWLSSALDSPVERVNMNIAIVGNKWQHMNDFSWFMSRFNNLWVRAAVFKWAIVQFIP